MTALCTGSPAAVRIAPDMQSYAWQTVAPRWYRAHGLDAGEVPYA
jgi:hypothetical protein